MSGNALYTVLHYTVVQYTYSVIYCILYCSILLYTIILYTVTDMRKDVQEIFRMTPHEKQVMMFSATLSKEIRPVCKKFMMDVRKPHTTTSSPASSPFFSSLTARRSTRIVSPLAVVSAVQAYCVYLFGSLLHVPHMWVVS